MAEAPPPYLANGAPVANNQYTRQPSISNLASHPQTNNVSEQPSTTTANTPRSIFPLQFGIYHASGTSTDLRISLSQESPSLFHISTHSGFSSQPSVVLHGGPSERTLPMAMADFHSFSSTVDIKLFSDEFLKLEREGAFSSVTYFNFPIPQADGQILLERFEWKSSSGPEVQSLQGSSRGMKCVRARTGEVVAAWARPNSGTRKKGKMRFLTNASGTGDRGKFETAIVITILSIMEKTRRKNANRGAVGDGVAGVAGAAGGGGC